MKHPYPIVGVIALLAAVAGCSHEAAPLTVPRLSGGAATAPTAATAAAPAPQWGTPASRARHPDDAGAIDAIIYSSNLSNEEMLRRLHPYLGGLGTKEGFEQRHGGATACSALPGSTSCIVPGSGLELIYDGGGVLRLMRRQARSVGGRSYATSPLTGPDFALR